MHVCTKMWCVMCSVYIGHVTMLLLYAMADIATFTFPASDDENLTLIFGVVGPVLGAIPVSSIVVFCFSCWRKRRMRKMNRINNMSNPQYSSIRQVEYNG